MPDNDPEYCIGSNHKSLHIIAHMTDGVMITLDRRLHIDGILAGEIFKRTMPPEWNGVPPEVGEYPVEIKTVPLARWRIRIENAHRSLKDPDGYVWGWCGSSMCAEWLGFGRHSVRRPTPVREFSQWGNQNTIVNTGLGVTKAWDKVYPTAIANQVHFYAMGDRDQVAELLSGVTGLGRLRNHGKGAVARWTVDVADEAPWDVYEGHPMRSLPDGWPGVSPEHPRANVTIRAPYWQHHRQILGYFPSAAMRTS